MPFHIYFNDYFTSILFIYIIAVTFITLTLTSITLLLTIIKIFEWL